MKKLVYCTRPERYVCCGKKIWGKLPMSGEIKEFNTVWEYRRACIDEENEFIDEMARLDAERIPEYPEDFKVVTV